MTDSRLEQCDLRACARTLSGGETEGRSADEVRDLRKEKTHRKEAEQRRPMKRARENKRGKKEKARKDPLATQAAGCVCVCVCHMFLNRMHIAPEVVLYLLKHVLITLPNALMAFHIKQTHCQPSLNKFKRVLGMIQHCNISVQMTWFMKMFFFINKFQMSCLSSLDSR